MISAKAMEVAHAWGANTQKYLRFRLMEWVIWCVALIVLYLVLPNDAGEGGETFINAIIFTAFANAYVYVLLYYAPLTALAFLLVSISSFRKPIGLLGWLLLNVGVPGVYGMALLVAFYGKSPDLTMWLSLIIVISSNAWLTVRESRA